MAALRAEVRAAVAIKEEIATVRTAVAALTPLSAQPDTLMDPPHPPISNRTAAEVVTESVRAGTLYKEGVKKLGQGDKGTSKSLVKSRPKPVVGSSATNSHVKGVETCRTVDIFVSRLHPETKKNELIDCVNTVKGDLPVQNIVCESLESAYPHLYSSFRVAVIVGASTFGKAIEIFTSAESWPIGVFVRRYFKPKTVSDGAK